MEFARAITPRDSGTRMLTRMAGLRERLAASDLTAPRMIGLLASIERLEACAREAVRTDSLAVEVGMLSALRDLTALLRATGISEPPVR